MSNSEFDKKPSDFVLDGFKPYGLIPRIKVRLKDFPDSEPAQAILRIVILACLTLIFAGASISNGSIATLEMVLFSYLVIAIGIFASIGIRATPSPGRRLFANLLDVTFTSICMILSPYSGGFLYWVYLFVTIGNGYRFGQRYLFISQAFSLVGFGFVCAFVPRYLNAENLWQTLGMFTGLILIPFYVRNFHTREERIRAKLIEARRHADAANDAKSRFVAMISHEMRTPLSGVHGSCEMLAGMNLDREQTKWVSIAQDCTTTLLGLINNVLDLSKVEAGKIILEHVPFDLHKLVDSVIAVLQPQVVGKSVRLLTVIDPTLDFILVGDDQRIRQVLINLVGNAIKFTHQGDVILQVEGVKERQAEMSIKFSVIDSGIGIAEDKQEQIFESFTQADNSTTREFGGTGLGTTIAKELVELMGGTLNLVSAPDKGTIFWFVVNLSKTNKVLEPENAATVPGGRVLLLNFDDAEVSRLRSMIGTWGFEADAIATIETLLATGHRKFTIDGLYSAVLLNATLFGGDLFKVAEMLKGDLLAPNSNVKLVLANYNDAPHPPTDLIKYGFNVLLRSPFDTRCLFNALHSAHSGLEKSNSDAVVPMLSLLTGKNERPAHDIRILLADDVVTNQTVFSAMLTKAGYAVDVVSDGEQALERLESNYYDVALLDLRMPIMSGIEVVKFYKFAHRETRPRFVLLTADVLHAVEEEARLAGIVEIVHKPITAAALVNVVRRWSQPEEEVSSAPETTNPVWQSHHGNAVATHVLINEQALAELASLSDNPLFLDQVIRGFISDGELLLLEFSSLLSKYDISQDRTSLARIGEVAHALKGNAAQLGLMPLSHLAASIQTTSIDTLSTAGIALLRQVRALFAQSVQELKSHVSRREIKAK